ncbi:DUF1444 family protein [Wielerella bovis]|uniref:DUF1444 family protein n=1 Tax=Wielerella bovis TaxID=2917790 RepID=UPI0020190DF0|nr:DUF1444 family protein [Wielerella bovis]ULJ65293.1 DUF1444 family protein [Wielerella bovis]
MSLIKNLFSNKQTIMNWREFAEYFAQEIQQNIDGTAKIEWGDDLENTTVHLTFNNGDQAESYLGNHFARYQHNPDDLPEIIVQTLVAVAHLGKDKTQEIKREHIFPTIKSAGYVNYVAQMYQKEGKNPTEHLCICPLAGDISLIYMVDTGDALKSLNRDDVAKLGIENDEMLHQIALENLENYLSQSEDLGYRQSENGLYQIYLDDVFDASLILLLEKIVDMAELDVAPYPVFAVPARDMLLVRGADNQDALAQMQEIIDDVMQDSSYCISAQKYCLKNGQMSLFNTH